MSHICFWKRKKIDSKIEPKVKYWRGIKHNKYFFWLSVALEGRIEIGKKIEVTFKIVWNLVLKKQNKIIEIEDEEFRDEFQRKKWKEIMSWWSDGKSEKKEKENRSEAHEAGRWNILYQLSCLHIFISFKMLKLILTY